MDGPIPVLVIALFGMISLALLWGFNSAASPSIEQAREATQATIAERWPGKPTRGLNCTVGAFLARCTVEIDEIPTEWTCDSKHLFSGPIVCKLH